MRTKKAIVCDFLAVTLVLAFGACSASIAPKEQRLTGPTDSFTFTVINDGTSYSVSKGTATEGAVNIPNYYRPNADSDYLPVTFISIGAFANGVNITNITIPSTVTTIGDNAFNYCNNLTSITIPKSVTEIGSNVFYSCTSLSSITIPASVTTIGVNTFKNCPNLTSITIPASVMYIGQSPFYGWTDSQTINIRGKANRAETISAGWHRLWDEFCGAVIKYEQ